MKSLVIIVKTVKDFLCLLCPCWISLHFKTTWKKLENQDRSQIGNEILNFLWLRKISLATSTFIDYIVPASLEVKIYWNLEICNVKVSEPKIIVTWYKLSQSFVRRVVLKTSKTIVSSPRDKDTLSVASAVNGCLEQVTTRHSPLFFLVCNSSSQDFGEKIVQKK